MQGIKTIHMGTNTEPIFSLTEEVLKLIESYKGVEDGLVKFKEEHKNEYLMFCEYCEAIRLKKEIEETLQKDGSCLLSFSCNGRERHLWQSEWWHKELVNVNGDIYDIELGENYYCKLSLKKS